MIPSAPAPHAKAHPVMRAIRLLLILAISAATIHLCRVTWLLSRPTPTAVNLSNATPETAEDPFLTAISSAVGYWTVDGMDIALRFAEVPEQERQQRWTQQATVPTGDQTTWEADFLRWIEARPDGNERIDGNLIERQGTWGDMRYRCIRSAGPPARVCLLQASWPISPESSGMLEALPVAGQHQVAEQDALLAWDDSVPMARRLNGQGKLTGAAYRVTFSAEEMIERWERKGIKLISSSTQGGITSYEAESPKKKRLLVLRLDNPDAEDLIIMLLPESPEDAPP